jgi:phage protein U
MNLNELTTYTRDLTGIYSADVVSDTLIHRWVNESYFELNRQQQWPWTASTLLAASSPTFDSQFHQILAYQAAVRVLAFVSDETGRAQQYTIEADKLSASMVEVLLPGTATGGVSTLAQLRSTVRYLVSDYSPGIPDALLTQWINETYDEVERVAQWPWSAQKVALVAGTDQPVIPAEFRPVLAYRTAAKVLVSQNDQTNRLQEYQNQSDALIASMLTVLLPSQATGTVVTLGQIRTTARFMLGNYSKTVSDAMLTQLINEAYDEVERAQQWPWAATKTTLTADSHTPVFEVQFRPMLAYRAAFKALTFLGDDSPRVQRYADEYVALLESLATHYLPAATVAAVGTLSELRATVRDIAGQYSKDVTDNLIDRLINQSYGELSRHKPWPWLERTVTVAVPADVDTVVLPDAARRILNVYVVDEHGEVSQATPVPHVLDVEASSQVLRYDTSDEGNLTLAPVPERPVTLRIRYVIRTLELVAGSDTPAFDPQYGLVLAYHAAAKLFGLQGDKSGRADTLLNEARILVVGMESEYLTVHDSSPFQLGGEDVTSSSRWVRR